MSFSDLDLYDDVDFLTINFTTCCQFKAHNLNKTLLYILGFINGDMCLGYIVEAGKFRFLIDEVHEVNASIYYFEFLQFGDSLE